MIRPAAASMLVMSALILGMSSAAAREVCVPVSGTILNNFTSATSTLGVVSMIYGTDGIKLKCALSGAQQAGAVDINYIHAISCEDSMSMPAVDRSGTVPVHSSIVLYTTGIVSGPALPTQLFTFNEVSVPIASAPATGLYFGATGGQIQVEGAVHKGACDPRQPGSIDMTFSGKVCYRR